MEYPFSQNKLEEIFLQVCSEVLGVEKLGVNDNLFELGGDSIKAIQIVAKLQNQGIQIEVLDLFSYTTIKSLSAFLINKYENGDQNNRVNNVNQGKERLKKRLGVVE